MSCGIAAVTDILQDLVTSALSEVYKNSEECCYHGCVHTRGVLQTRGFNESRCWQCFSVKKQILSLPRVSLSAEKLLANLLVYDNHNSLYSEAS